MKRMKIIKVLSWVFICSLILCCKNQAFAANGYGEAGPGKAGVKVYIEEKPVVYEAGPVVKNYRTLVPLRTTAELLGYKVIWYEGRNVVSVINSGQIVDFQIDENKAWINGNIKKCPAKFYVMDGVTMVPVRFLAAALGYQLQWNKYTGNIKIYKENSISIENLLKSSNKDDVLYGARLYYINQVLKQKGTITAQDLEEIK